MSAPTGSISDREILKGARRLRILSVVLEAGLYGVIAASLAAFGSVHEWAYVPLWYASGILLVLASEHFWTVRALRRRLGDKRFSFHPTGLWLVLDAPPPYSMRTWSYDLGAAQLNRAPLLRPAVLLAVVALLQLVPLPPSVLLALDSSQEELLRASPDRWQPLTISTEATLRGLAFLACVIAMHLVAHLVLAHDTARRRFRWFVATLGVLLTIVALAQRASGTRLIYGFFHPREFDGSDNAFGPFVNRNHFAGYMLLVAPLAVGLLADSARRYVRRLGPRTNLRRALVGLQSRDGVTLLFALVPALASVAGLVASNSRGALLAFAAAMLLAVLTSRKGTARWAGLVPVVLVVVALSWFGLERTAQRFGRAVHEAPGRTKIWKDSLVHARHAWVLGSGFNTFGEAVSRVSVWTLPKGATPWREPNEASVALVPRGGYRVYTEASAFGWYREAHNDYLQILVETGVPGLLIVLSALVALYRAFRGDPWILAAIAGVALHSLLDFDLQVPALAVLFVSVAGYPPVAARQPRRGEEASAPETAAEPPLANEGGLEQPSVDGRLGRR